MQDDEILHSGSIKTPSRPYNVEVEKKIEKLSGENQYMEHILEKVRDYFNLSSETAPIDIEIFLNKIQKKSNINK